MTFSDVSLTKDGCLVDNTTWHPWRAHDKHGRDLYRSDDGCYILKVEVVGENVPESWAEGLVWMRFFCNLEPGQFMYFNPIFATGSAIVDGEIAAWSIQPFLSGPNGYSQRDQCPPSPYFTNVIAEARAFAKSFRLNDRDLVFPGQYVYDAATGLAVCVDYGKTLKS